MARASEMLVGLIQRQILPEVRPISELVVPITPHELVIIVSPLGRIQTPLSAYLAILAEKQVTLAEVDDGGSFVAQALRHSNALHHEYRVVAMTLNAEGSISDVAQELIGNVEDRVGVLVGLRMCDRIVKKGSPNAKNI